MSVEIKFEPDGPRGLVAEGTGLLDAARRLGFRIPSCEGRGESDTCAIVVITGAPLLSDLTDAERRQLSPERLGGGERLACQCRVEHGGELIVRLVPATRRAQTCEEKIGDLRKEFSELPFERKISTLMQLETIAMSQVLDTIADSSVAFGKKLFDSVASKSSGDKQEQDRPRADKSKRST